MPPRTPFEEAVHLFNIFDANGDGLISKNELGWVLQRIDPVLWTSAKVDTLLGEADRNKDGRIDYAEFFKWIFGEGSYVRVFHRTVGRMDEKPRRTPAGV